MDGRKDPEREVGTQRHKGTEKEGQGDSSRAKTERDMEDRKTPGDKCGIDAEHSLRAARGDRDGLPAHCSLFHRPHTHCRDLASHSCAPPGTGPWDRAVPQ